MFEKSAEQAAADIRKFAVRELELVRDRTAKLAEVAAAERAAGDDYLEGNPGGVDRLLKLQTEMRMIGVALATCRTRRLESVQAKRAADIAALEQRVDGLRNELQKITEKLDKLVQKVTELLGVPVNVVPAVAGQLSNIQKLALQVQGIDEKIFRLQSDDVPDHGAIDLLDTTAGPDETVIAALMTEAICPPVEEIQQWYAGVEVSIGQPLGDHVRRVYLTWSNGQIDWAQSYIQVGDFCRPTGILSIHTGRPYLDNGIFRAEPVQA